MRHGPQSFGSSTSAPASVAPAPVGSSAVSGHGPHAAQITMIAEVQYCKKERAYPFAAE
jgi:hypothetical protein